ncbi:LysM domain-containing protein [Phytohabitans sp. ZYX-F-186]|uniref:LysM domain-containing protein n=1 Tax=Phytohabitans maris TaxID=3071409 RepID=A0ABU0ZGC7_9ACTN|nr:LysM domain-containing protein [Phytohabitans sp. ZYX-F-186]MDQ7905454.1 LysM domain-containing protein [Phytohabitans sp. ZYX-F-186]
MRLRQVVKGLGALVILIGLLVGAPVALAVFAGNPLPDHVPALSEIGDALTTRDDGQLFLRALAVVGWLGWATFALSVLVEIPARALRIPVPRLPGMRRQQRMAAALIGGVALIIGASPAMASAAATAPPTSYAAAPYTPATVSAPAAAAWERTAAAAADEDPVPVYRVERGDYLGHIADRYLGEFDRYPELAKLNKLRDPDLIRPGQMLHMPEGAADGGVRRHATGLVSVPPPPAAEKPAPPPAAGGAEKPDGTEKPDGADAGQTPSPLPGGGGSETRRPATEEPAVPYVPPPPTVQDGDDAREPVHAGEARPGEKERLNLPLAVTAVLTAASLVGAQIGVLLGLRDKRRQRTRRP